MKTARKIMKALTAVAAAVMIFSAVVPAFAGGEVTVPDPEPVFEGQYSLTELLFALDPEAEGVSQMELCDCYSVDPDAVRNSGTYSAKAKIGHVSELAELLGIPFSFTYAELLNGRLNEDGKLIPGERDNTDFLIRLDGITLEDAIDALSVNPYLKYVERNYIYEPDDGPGDQPVVFFDDVKDGAWYFGYVRSAFERGLMKGVSERRFNPGGSLTRAMTVTVIWRIAGEPKVDCEHGFKDVPDGTWFTDAVRWAKSAGIVNGVSENKFAPDSSITRADFAVMIHRYGDSLGVIWAESGETGDPTDIDAVPEYAKAAVTELFRAGIVQGKGDGLFDPTSPITRAEAAAMLVRAQNPFKENRTSASGETGTPDDGAALLESLGLEYEVYAWIDRMPPVESERENRAFMIGVKRTTPTGEPIPDLKVELRTGRGRAVLLRTFDFPDECRFYVADEDKEEVFDSRFSDGVSGFLRFEYGEKRQTEHFSVSVVEVW